jgi:hypothetical protein
MSKLLLVAAVLLTALAGSGARAADPPAPDEWQQVWADLGTKDPVQADRAMTRLVDRPEQAVPFLRQRLRPAPAADPRRLADWLAALDSEEFAVREEATQELEKLAEVIEDPLKKALRQTRSAEVRRRIEGVLGKVKGERLSPPPDRLRAARAVEVLERIDDCAARRLLANLAAGAPEAQLTVEAKSALERLIQSAP